MTMEELAARLSVCLGSGLHPVTDLTGIKGDYQLAYDCPLPGPRAPVGKDVASTPLTDAQDVSILTRSLDALGLKLEKRKLLQDVYVIDHVEKTSEN